MKILTTRFAASLLQSLHPVSIPVTASVYAYLHTAKPFTLPNLPLIEIEIACSGVQVGAALHHWARVEMLKHIKYKPNKKQALFEFYDKHNLSIDDYDYESATRNCTRFEKKQVKSLHFNPNHVVNLPPSKPPTLAQKLMTANTQIRHYCQANGYAPCPMFVSVLALRYNTKYTIFQIANNLDISRQMVHRHLKALQTLPFRLPSSVLCVD